MYTELFMFQNKFPNKSAKPTAHVRTPAHLYNKIQWLPASVR